MKRHTEAMTVRARARRRRRRRASVTEDDDEGEVGDARASSRRRRTRARARVVVEVFWDVDNLCPSEGCEREVARRLTRAASAFGDVRRCRAFANEETMSRISLERAVGVETTVVDASGMGDDVDDALAAAAAAFAREGGDDGRGDDGRGDERVSVQHAQTTTRDGDGGGGVGGSGDGGDARGGAVVGARERRSERASKRVRERRNRGGHRARTVARGGDRDER